MKMISTLVVFVVGVGIGYSATFLPSQYVDPYLPLPLQGKNTLVEGKVVRKQQESDRLLLTVSTPEGALLATFQSQVTEIDLLVEQGDTVKLALRAYQPFVTDPLIQAVMKPEFHGASSFPPGMAPPEEEDAAVSGDEPSSEQ